MPNATFIFVLVLLTVSINLIFIIWQSRTNSQTLLFSLESQLIDRAHVQNQFNFLEREIHVVEGDKAKLIENLNECTTSLSQIKTDLETSQIRFEEQRKVIEEFRSTTHFTKMAKEVEDHLLKRTEQIREEWKMIEEQYMNRMLGPNKTEKDSQDPQEDQTENTKMIQNFLTPERRLHNLLEINQKPKNCSQAPILLIFPNNFGLGSDLRWITTTLLYALDKRRTVVVHAGEWIYADKYRCPTRSMDCFLESLSSCTERDILAFEAGPFRPANKTSRVLWFDWSIHASQDNIALEYHSKGWEFVEQLFFGIWKDQGVESRKWLCRQLFSYVLRPSLVLKDAIRKVKDSLSLSKPWIGVHIRQASDMTSQNDLKKVGETTGHIETAVLMAKRFHIETIFFSFDTMKVFLELENRKASYPQYTFVYQQSFSLSPQKEYRYDDSDSLGALNTFVDLFILAEADILVADPNSNFAVLAAALGNHAITVNPKGETTWMNCLLF